MVSYCECRLVSVPAVIGLFRPVVLLPMRALTGLTPSQLEAVIAHELGHIKRFDVAVNFFQVIAETLFFFHPAVWWLNKRIRADREDCCDDVAIAACGREGWLRPRAGHHGRVARCAGFRTGRDRWLRGQPAWRACSESAERNASTRTAGVFTASLVLAMALTAGAASIGFAQSPIAPLVAQADVPAAPAPPVAPVPVPVATPALAPAA